SRDRGSADPTGTATPPSAPDACYDPRRTVSSLSSVPPDHADHDPLDPHVLRPEVQRRHRRIRRLETHTPVRFPVELLHRRGIPVHQRHHHLPVPRDLAGAHDDVVPIPDLLVDHRVSLHPQHVVLAAAADHVLRDRNGLLLLDRFDRHARGDRPVQRELDRARPHADGNQLDRATLVVGLPDVSLPLQILQVLVHGGQRPEAEVLRDLLEARRVPVLFEVLLEEVHDLLLASGEWHRVHRRAILESRARGWCRGCGDRRGGRPGLAPLDRWRFSHADPRSVHAGVLPCPAGSGRGPFAGPPRPTAPPSAGPEGPEPVHRGATRGTACRRRRPGFRGRSALTLAGYRPFRPARGGTRAKKNRKTRYPKGNRSARGMMSVLDRIVETKRAEVAALAPRAAELRRAAESAGQTRRFSDALRLGDRVAVIAEVKRRSPSAGWIRPDATAAEVAGWYEAAGASAISVLTDGEYFGGSLDDLMAVRSRVGVPVLRKDFVLDAVQLWEARAAGADAVLLIVRILDDAALADLLS